MKRTTLPIHEQVRLARESQAMTLRQLAAAIGHKNHQHLLRWESGDALPTIPSLAKIHLATGYVFQILVEGERAKEWAER